MQTTHEKRVGLVNLYLSTAKNSRLREDAEEKLDEEISQMLGDEFLGKFAKMKMSEKEKVKLAKGFRDHFIKLYTGLS